jgi:hypothetical protein
MMAKCDWCRQEMLDVNSCTIEFVHFPDGQPMPSIVYYARDNCHDCNVKPGGYHHPGCDMEICPKCGGQLISCGCPDDDEDENEEMDWAEQHANLGRI